MSSYKAGDCDGPPTLMQNYFDGSDLPTAPLVSNFDEQRFGGYKVSGKQYLGEVCFGSNCQIMNVYSGNNVTQNEWNYNKDGSYGIIGMGPSSGLWSSFISPGTAKAMYSIELARFSNPLSAEKGMKATDDKSNITLGYANDEYYESSTAMTLTAMTNYTYELDYFGFGKVYTTNGEATSAYFSAFDLGRPV